MMIPWHFALSFSFLLWGLDGKDEDERRRPIFYEKVDFFLSFKMHFRDVGTHTSAIKRSQNPIPSRSSQTPPNAI